MRHLVRPFRIAEAQTRRLHPAQALLLMTEDAPHWCEYPNIAASDPEIARLVSACVGPFELVVAECADGLVWWSAGVAEDDERGEGVAASIAIGKLAALAEMRRRAAAAAALEFALGPDHGGD